MRKLLFLFALLLSLDLQAATVPARPWAHPRLWLTSAVLESLQARATRETAEWTTLKDWADADLSKNFSLEQVGSSRITGYSLAAIGYSLVFVADASHSNVYANKAYDIIVGIDSVADNYNATYDSIGIVTTWEYGYNTRRIMYAAAITYDWCYDSLSTARRDRLRNLLTKWTRGWYLRRTAEPDGSSCFDPGNNFYGGHLIGLLSSGYALYYDNALADSIWAKRAVSYGRDTMLVESAKNVLGRKLMWDRYGEYENTIKGGFGAEGWPAYLDALNEFTLQAMGLAAHIENEDTDICTLFGTSYPREFLMSVMYALVPHTNFDSGWKCYAWGDGATTGSLNDNTFEPFSIAMYLGGATNDTVQTAKWWWDTYYPEVTIADYYLWMPFLFVDPTTTPIDPEVDDTALGDAWVAEGSRSCFYRNNWHDESADDISFELHGGYGKNDHSDNMFNSFRLNAGDNLVSNYNALSGTGDIATWTKSGMYIQPDGSSPLAVDCDRRYNDTNLHGDPTIDHYKNSDTMLYYSVDVTPIFEWPYTSRTRRIAHFATEWMYLKADSVLLMMDRGITIQANYRRLEPTNTGCDTLWAAKESNKQWQIWSETEPTAYGGGWRIAGKSNVADLIVDCSFPTTGINSTAILRKKFKTSATPTAEWRTVDSLATPNTDFITLHTMKIVPDAGPFSLLTATNTLGHCAVSAFRSNRIDTLDYLVAFNADSAAQEFSGDSIIFGHTGEPRENTTVIVANLASSTEYFWKAIPASGLLAVTLSKTDPGDYTAVTSDTAGIAVFDIGAPEAGEECATVTPSNIKTVKIGANSAVMYFDTDFNVHGGFRYHVTGGDSWTYRHDADQDSSGHYVQILGLTSLTDYTFEINTKLVECDSTAYGDSTSFAVGPPIVPPPFFSPGWK